MGNREANLKEAVSRIGEKAGRVLIVSSSVYETEPWGFEADNNFLNMVIVGVETKLSPSGLLGAILMIEVHLGRLRSEKAIFIKGY